MTLQLTADAARRRRKLAPTLRRRAAVVPLVRMLTPTGVFLARNQVMGDMLRGRKRPPGVACPQGFVAVFTVIPLVTLLPVVGVYGAVTASVMAYGVALVMMLFSLRRLPPDSPGTRQVTHPVDLDLSQGA